MPHDTLPWMPVRGGKCWGSPEAEEREGGRAGCQPSRTGSELGRQEGGAGSEPTHPGLGRAGTLLEQGGDVLKMLALPRLA